MRGKKHSPLAGEEGSPSPLCHEKDRKVTLLCGVARGGRVKKR